MVLVAAITSRKTENVYPFEALIEPPDGGLSQRSKVLLMELRSLDKRRILGLYGVVSAATLNRVNVAVQIAVGLTRLS